LVRERVALAELAVVAAPLEPVTELQLELAPGALPERCGGDVERELGAPLPGQAGVERHDVFGEGLAQVVVRHRVEPERNPPVSRAGSASSIAYSCDPWGTGIRTRSIVEGTRCRGFVNVAAAASELLTPIARARLRAPPTRPRPVCAPRTDGSKPGRVRSPSV